MEVWGVLPVVKGSHGMLSSEPIQLTDENIIHNIRTINDKSLIKSALSSCHSLTVIDGEICGEPLDVTMFKATGWVSALMKTICNHNLHVTW